MVTASEPVSGQTSIQLQVNRGPGLFGKVSVDFQVL